MSNRTVPDNKFIRVVDNTPASAARRSRVIMVAHNMYALARWDTTDPTTSKLYDELSKALDGLGALPCKTCKDQMQILASSDPDENETMPCPSCQAALSSSKEGA